jgi:predicted small integral membrane protein
MNERMVSRLICLVMALFPALWGIFSLMNNLADFDDTVNNAVAPLLSMQDTYQVPGLMWRAIATPGAAGVGLALITTTEALAGVFACTGLLLMLRHLFSPYPQFATGKACAMLGAGCAVMVWGVGFMVVAGDWFMAWQAKDNPLATQLGALLYTAPNMLALLYFLGQKESA